MYSCDLVLLCLLGSLSLYVASEDPAHQCALKEINEQTGHMEDALQLLQVSAFGHHHAEQNVGALHKGSPTIGKWSSSVEQAVEDKPLGSIANNKNTQSSHTLGINVNHWKPVLPGALASLSQSCVPMQDEEDYFTVRVLLGTPPQPVNMVADTGSTLFVAESCFCKEKGDCKSNTHCFKGRGFSRTFHHNPYAPLDTLTYGSGDITVMRTGDIARVGDVSANMSGALMLMTESTMNIAAPEGVLGLGIPDPTAGAKGFLEKANIGRFKICFNEGGGTLYLHAQLGKQDRELRQVGSTHWALDLGGVSVGEEPMLFNLGICDPRDKYMYQNTACAAIPDSGTTFVLMPSFHMTKLFAAFCDSWQRCADGTLNAHEKQKKFVGLLEACEDWLDEDQGIEEIPSMHLHFVGALGNHTQIATLTPWSFVMEYPVDSKPSVLNSLFGNQTITIGSSSDDSNNQGRTRRSKECVPTFAPVDYTMEDTGALWIVGTPLFYEYTVGFDLTTEPASVVLGDNEHCGSCEEDRALYSKGPQLTPKPAKLMKQSTSTKSGTKSKSARPLRSLNRSPRFPHIDMSRPV